MSVSVFVWYSLPGMQISRSRGGNAGHWEDDGHNMTINSPLARNVLSYRSALLSWYSDGIVICYNNQIFNIPPFSCFCLPRYNFIITHFPFLTTRLFKISTLFKSVLCAVHILWYKIKTTGCLNRYITHCIHTVFHE